jgi:hypothetical protein
MGDVFADNPFTDLRDLLWVRETTFLCTEVAEEYRLLLTPLGFLGCDGGSGEFGVEQYCINVLEVFRHKAS